MINNIYKFIFLITVFTFYSKASIEDEEQWKSKIQQNATLLHEASIRSDARDSSLFNKKHASSQEAVAFLLFQYPSKKGGLYSLYKQEVHELLERNIDYLSPNVEWGFPWGQIALTALGAVSPLQALPSLICLYEIRRITEFKQLYTLAKDFHFSTLFSKPIGLSIFSLKGYESENWG